ncbi:hypothetical protein BGX21_002876, partial [Mortierella sp. AD011]
MAQPNISSIHGLQRKFLIERQHLEWTNIWETFAVQFNIYEKGALTDALRKCAIGIIHDFGSEGQLKWAHDLIEAIQSSGFHSWFIGFRQGTTKRLENIAHRNVNDVVDAVDETFATVTGASPRKSSKTGSRKSITSLNKPAASEGSIFREGSKREGDAGLVPSKTRRIKSSHGRDSRIMGQNVGSVSALKEDTISAVTPDSPFIVDETK